MALLVRITWLCTLVATLRAQDHMVAQTCPSDKPWIDVEPEADVIIGAILNVHERGGGVFGCGNPFAKGVHYFEALRWAIQTLNMDSGYLNGRPTDESFIPGVKLGLRAYDSCTHKELAVRYMTELFPVLKTGSQACGTDDENATRIIGVVDATENVQNPRISDAINQYLIPVIPLNQATTVPPEQLAKVLAEVVHDTDWERVAILHADDEYSVFVTKIFGKIAFNGFPCIAAMKSLPSQATGAESITFGKLISTFISKLSDRTGVVVIAHGESLKTVLKILGTLPQTSRLQWLFSWIPPAQELTEAFRKNKLAQVFSLSPYPNKISEFDDYWARLQDVASIEKDEDRWFLEYAMFRKNCRVAGYPGRQTVSCENLVIKEPTVDELLRVTRFLPSFHAVFTFAQAYKRAWSEKCLGTPGVCRELRAMTRTEFVEKFLETVEFDHQPEARSPLNIRGQKTNTSVRGEVDGLQMALNMYTFSQSTGLEFKQVFAYDAREAKVLDENFRYLPSNCPEGGCKNCISVRQARLDDSDNDISPSEDFVTIARPEDILIPIILPLHQSGNNPMECGNVMNPEQVQNLEAALWTLDQINSDPEYLPGVRLGAVAIDSCSSPLTLTQRLSGYLVESQKINTDEFLLSLAVITAGDFDEFNSAATVVTPLNITLISTTDVIKPKNMKNTYLQTAPSAEYRLEAITETLKFFGWTFISVVHDLDAGSQEQLKMFKEHALNTNLCFASEFEITDLDPSEVDYITAQVIQAKNRGANVIVLFTSDTTTITFLNSLRRAYQAGITTELDFIIICNGQWISDFNNLKNFTNQTFGGLLFKPGQGDVKDFRAFYQRLEPDGNKRNPWFVKMWNTAKQYQLNKSNLYAPTTSTVNIIQAVLAISAGLARLRNDLCHPDAGLCPKFYQQPHMRGLFHKYIHETASSKLDTDGDMFSFTKQGYANIPIDMISFKTTPMKTFAYQKVATFQNYSPNLTGSAIYSVAGEELAIDDVASECTHACPRCGKKTTDFLVLDSEDKLYLAAAMGVHESASDRLSCGSIIPSPGIQTVEAFLWAVDQINNSPQILPGVTLGALVFDTCNSRERAARDVSNFLSDSLTSVDGAGGLPSNKNVLGLIATQSDDVIESIIDVTTPSKLLTVATDATSSKFNDISQYPALFRTSLPNDVLAEGLADILKHFKWSFVSVVYSEDDRSKADLFNVFKGEAEKRNIELATVGSISSSSIASSTAMRSLLLTLDAKKEQGARIVVLLLTSSHLATLFSTIEKQRTLGAPSVDDLVWTAIDNRETFHKYPEISLGAIMLRPRTSTITPFRQHFEHLTLQNNTRNPWFKEFIEQVLHCRGAPCYKEASIPKMPFLQHPSVTDVINSVLSIGVALESVRDGLCPGMARGICRAMKEEPHFREMLLNISRTISFMGVEGDLFKYTSRNYAAGTLGVYNFIQVGNNARAFVEVGKFSPDEGLSLNYSKVRTYNRYGHDVSLYEIESKCNNSETCQSYEGEKKIAMMQVPSQKQFAISALMPIHKKGKNFFECGDLKDEQIFQNLAALTYAVNKVNKNEVLLPGVNLGMVVFDYCERKQRAEEQLYTFFSKDSNPNIHNKPRVTPKSIIATLTYGDDVAMNLSPILEASDVVQIAAPTDKLNFKNENDIIQTVPPSMAQVQVLLNILKRFQWRYVNLIYSNTDFGRAAHYQFAKGTKQSDICLASVIRLDSQDQVNSIASKLRDNLEKLDAKVVVLLVDDVKQINATIEAARRDSILHKFIWISSDSWGTNDLLAQSIQTLATNVLTIQMEAKDDPEFLDYFADMTPRRHSWIPDTWFDEFWQRKFNCRLQDSSSPLTQFTKVCTGEERLNIEDIAQNKYVYHSIDVVDAIARGLHKYLVEKCPHGMAATSIDDCGEDAQKELMLQIKKMISSRESVECEECGPYGTMFGYDVFQLKSNDDDTSYSKVGNWKDGKLFIDENQVKFTFGTIPKSVCRSHCDTCASQLGRPETLVDTRESIYDNFKEVWGITVSALSVLGMVLVIICALYFLMSFPVTVGTTVLGYMILFGLVLLYAVNFAFIIAPTEGTCGIRRFGLGLAYAIIFSGMLVKVMNTWRLMGYNGSRMLNDGTRLSSPAGLLVIAVGLVIIQIVLSAAWLILIPPKIGAYEMVWRCAPPTTFEEGLVVSLVYVMLLLAITTLFAIMTWQCQDNNKESRWILACSTMVAVVWLAWTILSTQISPHHRDLTIAAANLVNATIIMVCLYLRKVYLYSKLTRQAKDQDLKAHLQPSNYPHSLYGTSQKTGPFSTLAPVLYGSQASLNGKKLYNGPSSRLELINCPEDNKSDSSGSVQVQAADLYPLDMYDGGSQFQPVSSLFGSNHTLVLDDTLTFNR